MKKTKIVHTVRTRWTAAEVRKVRKLYPHVKTQGIALQLGRTLGQVYQKAAALGLKKTVEYLSSPDACRLRRGDNVGAEYRFKLGQVVWNKGTNFTAGGRSPETRFKPGNVPANRLPVGHIRLNSEGYLDIKTAPGRHKFVPLHRWNWKQAYGEYPAKGMMLIFKDGDKQNCDISNLECISRADLMKRNSVHNLPKKLAEIVQLRGALNRKINKRTKT
jgi:hypothetical protein